MIITVTNPRNSLSLTFSGEQEYRAKYGVLTRNEKACIAIEERDYELYARGLGGLFSLPQSTSYFVKGYQQDGSDFQRNEYENRIITFEFFQHYGTTNTQQSQVFNQVDHLLDVQIETALDTFYIQGHLNGTIEGGVVELECPYPFFRTKRIITQNEVIWGELPPRIMLPMTLPQILVGRAGQNGIVEFDATFPTDFIMTLTGSWSEVTITSMNAGTILAYNGDVAGEMIIDTAEQTVIIDGLERTEEVTGVFPTLFEGKNTFEIKIPDGQQETDVNVTIDYQEVRGNIE